MTASGKQKPVDEAALRRLAGARVFARGREYFVGGQAFCLAASDAGIAGWVLGTRAYRTELRRAGDELAFSCDCPVGAAGRFCKHAAALGLRWLAGEDGGAECQRLLESVIASSSLHAAAPGEDELARIWLAEGETAEALRAAQAGDCADELWLKLAALLVRAEPEQALLIYQRLVRRLLSRKDRASAGEAKRLLRKTPAEAAGARGGIRGIYERIAAGVWRAAEFQRRCRLSRNR